LGKYLNWPKTPNLLLSFRYKPPPPPPPIPLFLYLLDLNPKIEWF
jgi:hypothetical protein